MADVSVKRKVEVAIFGAPSVSTSITEHIQGDKSCNQFVDYPSEHDGISKDSMASEVLVVRIDKGVTFLIDYNSGTYDEIPLEMFGELKRMTGRQGSSYENDPMIWSMSVESDLNKVIDGHNCSGSRVKAEGVNSQDSLENVVVSLEQWNTNDYATPKELSSIREKLFGLIGMDLNPQNMVIEDMVSLYFPHIEELSTIVEDLSGFPVQTVLSIDVSDSPELETKDKVKSRTIYREAVEMMKNISTQTGQKLSSGRKTVFSLISNFVDLKTDPVDSALFEVPEGFIKIAD